jgi:PAS domain S-box-containing protein
MAVYILQLGIKSPLNLNAAALMLSFALWSGGMFFMNNKTTPADIINFIWHLYSVGWITFPAFTLLFTIELTKKKNVITPRYIRPALLLATVFLVFLHWTNRLMKPPVFTEYGWHTFWYENIYDYIYYAYYISLTLTAIILTANYSLKVKNSVHKRSAIVISLCSSITLIIGTFIEVILPRMSLNPAPFNDATDIIVLIWGFSILYAVANRSFFKITPASAAENIISSMGEALILLNDSFEIIYLNGAASGLLGCRGDNLIGRPSLQLFINNADALSWMKKLLIEENIKGLETSLKDTHGAGVSVMLSSCLIKEEGNIAGAVCVASDIREIKKSQQDLKDSYEKLKELDSVKESFMSMISHELRTPVTAIKGFTAFLAGGIGGELSKVQEEYIGNIKNNSDRLLVLINDLLDTAKMESGSFSITKKNGDINKIIEQCASDIRSLLSKKSITLVVRAPNDGLFAEVDAYRLAQSITNLLNNSIKFSPALSTISIHAGQIESLSGKIPPHADISQLGGGPYIMISVTDQGAGIESGNLEKVFERFYQVENINTRTVQGTGLGLNIVKNIIELHGGSVWVESEGKNCGSTFKMVFPAV